MDVTNLGLDSDSINSKHTERLQTHQVLPGGEGPVIRVAHFNYGINKNQ